MSVLYLVESQCNNDCPSKDVHRPVSGPIIYGAIADPFEAMKIVANFRDAHHKAWLTPTIVHDS